MSALIAAYGEAVRGHPRMLIVGGDAGVGKSRLATEFLVEVRAAGGIGILGRCADVEGGLPFGPLVEAFRDLITQLGPNHLPTELTYLSPILPEVMRDRSIKEPASRTALFHGMADVLTGTGRPIVIVIEDVHWSDRSTRDTVTFLRDRCAGKSLALVATIRTDEADPSADVESWLGELKRSPVVGVLDLQPLGREAAGRQIQEITGEPPAPAVLDAIYKRSQGNPFLTEELLAAGSGVSIDLLPSLGDLFLGKVSALDPDTREVLRAISVRERPVAADDLTEVLQIEPSRIAQALRAAMAAQVLIREPGDRYRFRHALLRELLYEELTSFERRRYHAAVARTLSVPNSSDAGLLSEIAHHWWEANEPRRARIAFIRAADAAEVALAHAEAAQHLVVAAELGEQLDEHDPPTDVLYERAAREAGLSGNWNSSADLVQTALGLVDRSHDPARAAHLMQHLAWIRWWAFRKPGTALLEEALELVPTEPPTALRARLLRTYANFLGQMGCPEGRLYHLNSQALEIATRARDPLEEGWARVQLGTILSPSMSADFGPVLKGLDLIKRHGTAEDIMDASVRIADALLSAGDFEALLEVTGDAMALASELEIHDSWPGLQLVSLNAWFFLGRWREAERLEEPWWDAGSALGAMRRIAMLPIWVGQGDFEKARENVELAAAMGDEGAGPYDVANFVCNAGLYYLWAEDLDQASVEVRRGVAMLAEHPELPHALDFFFLGLQVEASRINAGSSEAEARRLADEYIEGTRRVTVGSQDRLAPIILVWNEAEYARALREHNPALWAQAAEGWAQVKAPWYEAWARWRQAEAILLTGESRAAAAVALVRARELAVDLGAGPLMAEIDALARRARIEIPEPDRERDAGGGEAPIERYGLTPRELEVLRLVSVGKTNPEIAADLFISAKTASVHVSHILDKLGVSRRVEAAGIAHNMGLTKTSG